MFRKLGSANRIYTAKSSAARLGFKLGGLFLDMAQAMCWAWNSGASLRRTAGGGCPYMNPASHRRSMAPAEFHLHHEKNTSCRRGSGCLPRLRRHLESAASGLPRREDVA